MLFDMPNGGTILLAPSVLAIFRKERQLTTKLPESGGYLFGKLYQNQLVINVATLPGKSDLRRVDYIKRNRSRGQKLLNRAWRASDGKIFLAGEWHTHAHPHPQPSMLDIREASKAFKKYTLNLNYMVVVIVGSRAIVDSWVGIQTEAGLVELTRGGYQLSTKGG